ncbi:MAG: ribonuclease R, partial [Betaproteobacteria bacterium]|nr:ribonuclease R [Betaproteobacteria bacterium]
MSKHRRARRRPQPQRSRSGPPKADSFSEILEILERASAPLTRRELGKRAGDKAALAAALEALELTGRVVRNRAGSYLVAKRIDVVAGRIEGHRDGFGFLVRDDGGPDVFLPQEEMRQAMHGDRVAVRLGGED